MNNKFLITDLKNDVNEIQKIIDEIRGINNEQMIYYCSQIEQMDKQLRKIKD